MLKPLSLEARHQIRSGVAICSFAQCAEELILNSVDAGATCIAVRVDLVTKKLQVVDNGKGIYKEDLEQLGERYHTSKCHELNDLEDKLQHYGYRGEALASIRQMCYLLDVETRANGTPYTYSKIYKEGQAGKVTEAKTQRPSTGTTITVYDLFHSMPVRNKCLNQSLELERIRNRIEAAALVKPNISISLKNEVNGNRILQTHKANSVVGTFAYLFGTSKSRPLCEVKSESENFKVRGFISKDSNSNKNLQFVYINDRLVLKTKIHKMINMLMSKTIVLKKKGFYNRPDAPAKWSPGNTTEDVGPSKHTDRYAVYVVNIMCPLSAYDITFDPAKTLVEFKDWEAVLKCVESAVKLFIEKESLIACVDNMSLSPGSKAVLSQKGNGDTEGVDKDNSVNGHEKDKNYGNAIATHDISYSLQSNVIRRSQIEQKSKNSTNSSKGNLMTENGMLLSEEALPDQSGESVFDSVNESPGTSKTTVIKETLVEDSEDVPCGALTRAFLQKQKQEEEENDCVILETESCNNGKISKQWIDKTKEDTSYEGMRKKVALFHQCGSVTNRSNRNRISRARNEKLSKHYPLEDPWDEMLKLSSESTDNESESPITLTKKSSTENIDDKRTNLMIKEKARLKTRKYNLSESSIDCRLFQSRSQSGNSNLCIKSPSPRRRDKTFVSFSSQNPTPSTSFSSSVSARKHKNALSPLQKVQNKYNLLYHSKKRYSPLKCNLTVKKQKVETKSTRSEINIDMYTSDSECEVSEKDVISNIGNSTMQNNELSKTVRSVSKPNEDVYLDEDPLSSIQSSSQSLVVTKNSSNCEAKTKENISDYCNASSSKQVSLTLKEKINEAKKSPISSSRSFLSPLQRIREKLLAKSQLRKSNLSQGLSSMGGTSKQISTFKKHADVSKHKNSPNKNRSTSSTSGKSESKKSLYSKDKMPNISSDCLMEESDETVESALNLFKSPQSRSSSNTSVDTLNRHEIPIYIDSAYENQNHNKNCKQLFQFDHGKIDKDTYAKEKKPNISIVCSNEEPVEAVKTALDLFKSPPNVTLEKQNPKRACKHLLTSDIGEINKDTYLENQFAMFRQVCQDCSGGKVSVKHFPDPSEHNDSCINTSSSNIFEADLRKQDYKSRFLGDNVFQTAKSYEMKRIRIGLDNVPDKKPSSDMYAENKTKQSSSVYNLVQSIENMLDHTPDSDSSNNENLREQIAVSSPKYRNLELDRFDEPKSTKITRKNSEDQSTIVVKSLDYDLEYIPLRLDIECVPDTQVNHLLGKSGQSSVLSSNKYLPSNEKVNLEGLDTSRVKLTGSATIPDDNCDINDDSSFDIHTNVSIAESQGFCLPESMIESASQCTGFNEKSTSNQQSIPVTVNDNNKDTTNQLSEICDNDVQVNREQCSISAKKEGENSVENRDIQNNWICKVDPRSGGKLYVNVKTGHSSLKRPEIPCYDITTKVIKNKYKAWILTDNAAPFLDQPKTRPLKKKSNDENDTKTQLMLNFEKQLSETSEEEHNGNNNSSNNMSVTQLFEKWENPNYQQPPTSSTNIETGSTHKYAQLSLDPVRFSKDMLKDLQVLKQVDKKFIACIMKKSNSDKNEDDCSLLVVIDQHAAHERVRLEQFIEGLYDNDGSSSEIKTSSVNPPLEVCTTEHTVRIMEAYKTYFSKIGIKYKVMQRDTISVHSIPTCFVQEQDDESKPRDMSFLLRQIQLLIREQVDVLEKTRGCNATIPKTIHNVLCSRACHGAIKFGDPLKLTQCEELIANLRHCQLPFQCAHGRPSIMPLLDLEKINSFQVNAVSPPKLWKLKEGMVNSK